MLIVSIIYRACCSMLLYVYLYQTVLGMYKVVQTVPLFLGYIWKKHSWAVLKNKTENFNLKKNYRNAKFITYVV